MHKRDSAFAALAAQTPRTLFAETPLFFLRTLDVSDARENWCAWLMDPATQTNLNTKAKRLSLDEVRTYIASFDRVRSHLFGILDKQTDELVGIRAAFVDRQYSEFLVNTLIGEAGARGRGAQRETRYAMHNFFFEDLDLESSRANVVGTNAYMIQNLTKTGWVHEHTSFTSGADGQGAIEIRHFRLTRDVWRSVEAAKAHEFCPGCTYEVSPRARG